MTSKASKNPPWTEEELLLTLELYLDESTIVSKDKKIESLSIFLRTKNFPREIVSENFRNKNSIKLKLSNFAALDPTHQGKGMNRYSKKDVEIWNLFSADESALAEECERIRNAHPKEKNSVNFLVLKIPLEKNQVDNFFQNRKCVLVDAERKEAQLLKEYTQYLAKQGKRLFRYQYTDGGYVGLCDLFIENDNLLIEAKGNTKRELIRLAVGQLFDYCRYYEVKPSLGILLPRRPSESIISFLKGLNVKVIWKSPIGWAES